jgi:hypothetical protein
VTPCVSCGLELIFGVRSCPILFHLLSVNVIEPATPQLLESGPGNVISPRVTGLVANDLASEVDCEQRLKLPNVAS